MTDTREIVEKSARDYPVAAAGGITDEIETALAAYGREQREQGFREGAEAMREVAVARVDAAKVSAEGAANRTALLPARDGRDAEDYTRIEESLRNYAAMLNGVKSSLSGLQLPTPPDGESGEAG